MFCAQSGHAVRKARAVLGLSGSSDEVALKKAYRLKALECHPDKVAAHNTGWATAEMQHVNNAYAVAAVSYWDP